MVEIQVEDKKQGLRIQEVLQEAGERAMLYLPTSTQVWTVVTPASRERVRELVPAWMSRGAIFSQGGEE